jgi:hypothetical protein
MTEAVRQAFIDVNTCVDYIPAGYTSKLQPMDLGCNKPFKNYLSNEFDAWLVENMHRKPKRNDVATWIKKSWDEVRVQTITNSFRRAGLIRYNDIRMDLDLDIDDDVDPADDPLRMILP